MLKILALEDYDLHTWMAAILSKEINLKMKRENYYQLIFFLTILLSFLSFKSFPQNFDRSLNSYAKVMGFKYTRPTHFLELDSGTFIKTNTCGFRSKGEETYPLSLKAPFSYSIISKQKDIVITFMFNEGPMFNLADYNRILKLYPDTINHHIIRYARKYLSETSRATVGCLYVPNCPYLYKKEYPNIKIVILHKEGKGTIQMFYYYKDQASNRIRKCIRRTAGIIKFNE